RQGEPAFHFHLQVRTNNNCLHAFIRLQPWIYLVVLSYKRWSWCPPLPHLRSLSGHNSSRGFEMYSGNYSNA
uniref:Uncharacterized protein n=1 Tax=Gasterosteus aculeatus aculeatus TaxID=481459 RepID=A0AAQ4PAS0_GASAC